MVEPKNDWRDNVLSVAGKAEKGMVKIGDKV